MGKKQDIHYLIENQKDENREILLDRINEQISVEQSYPQGEVIAQRSTNIFKWASICVVIVVLIAAAVTLAFFLQGWKDNTDSIRFCTSADYYTVDSEQTLKEYSSSVSSQVLYLSDALGFEHVLSQYYNLNEDDKTICVYEESISEDHTLYIFVVNGKFEMDFLENYEKVCVNELNVEATKVLWCQEISTIYVKFEYAVFNYFLQIDEAYSTDIVSDIVKDLLSSAK